MTRKQPKKLKSPVIAARVRQPLYERIKKSAWKSGRTMSEELAWRLDESFRISSATREATQHATKEFAKMLNRFVLDVNMALQDIPCVSARVKAETDKIDALANAALSSTRSP